MPYFQSLFTKLNNISKFNNSVKILSCALLGLSKWKQAGACRYRWQLNALVFMLPDEVYFLIFCVPYIFALSQKAFIPIIEFSPRSHMVWEWQETIRQSDIGYFLQRYGCIAWSFHQKRNNLCRSDMCVGIRLINMEITWTQKLKNFGFLNDSFLICTILIDNAFLDQY